MATFTTYADGATIAPDKTVHTGLPGVPTRAFIMATLDFTRRSAATTDKVAVINIPAGAYVQGVYMTTNVAGTATNAFNVGDSGSATRFATAQVGTSTAGTQVALSTTARQYTADDQLLIAPSTAADTGAVISTGKYTFTVEVVFHQ